MRATTTTLGQLVEHVENVSRGNHDETIPLSDMEFANLKEMYIGNVCSPAAEAQSARIPISGWMSLFRIIRLPRVS